MGKRRPVPVPEERLVATVTSWRASYYIAQSSYEVPIGDEAITTLQCQIAEVEKRHEQHLGQPIEIAFVCARRYADEKEDLARPSLFYLNLRKNQRSLLLYLPTEPYWSLPSLLDHAPDPCIEVSFERLYRGTGTLRSIWVGSYAQLLEDRAELAELNRGK